MSADFTLTSKKKKWSSQTFDNEFSFSFFRSDEITEKQHFHVKRLNSCIFKKKEKEKVNLQRPIAFNQKEIITERFFLVEKLTVLYRFRIC